LLIIYIIYFQNPYLLFHVPKDRNSVILKIGHMFIRNLVMKKPRKSFRKIFSAVYDTKFMLRSRIVYCPCPKLALIFSLEERYDKNSKF